VPSRGPVHVRLTCYLGAVMATHTGHRAPTAHIKGLTAMVTVGDISPMRQY